MLYQLRSGRTIELSLDQYLDMSDEELNELEGLGSHQSMEINNPFYNSYKGSTQTKKDPVELTDEHDLTSIPKRVKLEDKYFHNKDED